VIDDHDVSALGARSGAIEKAGATLTIRALVAHAGLAGRLDISPHVLLRTYQDQLGTITSFGGREPGEHLGQHAHLIGRGLARAPQDGQAPQAEVVAPPL